MPIIHLKGPLGWDEGVGYPTTLDNHDGVITHLEPDILECEVKRALGSISMDKASGGDGIPAEIFQILKDDALKCFTQYVSKFGKLSKDHRTGKGQFSFQPLLATERSILAHLSLLSRMPLDQIRWLVEEGGRVQ